VYNVVDVPDGYHSWACLHPAASGTPNGLVRPIVNWDPRHYRFFYDAGKKCWKIDQSSIVFSKPVLGRAAAPSPADDGDGGGGRGKRGCGHGGGDNNNDDDKEEQESGKRKRKRGGGDDDGSKKKKTSPSSTTEGVRVRLRWPWAAWELFTTYGILYLPLSARDDDDDESRLQTRIAATTTTTTGEQQYLLLAILDERLVLPRVRGSLVCCEDTEDPELLHVFMLCLGYITQRRTMPSPSSTLRYNRYIRTMSALREAWPGSAITSTTFKSRFARMDRTAAECARRWHACTLLGMWRHSDRRLLELEERVRVYQALLRGGGGRGLTPEEIAISCMHFIVFAVRRNAAIRD
jgi:hypothetical protein